MNREEKYILDRIIKDLGTGCWNWTAYKNKDGYAFGGKNVALCRSTKEVLIHRASYVFYKGAIPAGLYVLHRCDNPSCVNPDHLFLGTHQDNMNDMWNKERRRIKYGEESHRAVLKENDVRYIREHYKYRDKNFSAVALSKVFDVTVSCIHNVLKRRTWAKT